jgi:hypothetical protein
MTCKDCVHYEVCAENDAMLGENTIDEIVGVENHCEYFKPKSRFVEVPDDKNIIFVKDNWLMLNMESEHLGEAIKASVDYLTKNAG